MIKKAIMLVSIMILSVGITIAGSDPDVPKEEYTYAIITGSVVDSSTGEAVENATVEITETEQSIITDEYGTFVFEQVETGNYTLSVEADGYQTTEKSVVVTEEGVNVEIAVEPEM